MDRATEYAAAPPYISSSLEYWITCFRG